MKNHISKPLSVNSNHGRFRFLWTILPGLLTVTVFIVVIYGLAIWISAKADANKEDQGLALTQTIKPAMVVAMDLEPGLIQERLNLPGVVKPWVDLDVVAEVTGMIAEKRVDKGHSVNKGDVLARIDDRDYQNSYQSAQAAYDAAQISFNRLSQLLNNRAATAAQVDEARAQMEATKAAMANAKLRLERTTIRSPLTGVVDQMFIESGQYVNSGDPIAKVLQIDKVKVQVGIPESDVDAVGRVKDFKVTIDALGGKVFSGRFSFLSKSAQSMARLYNLEIGLDNPRGEILPDMFTRVDIVTRQVNEGLSVPLFSLIQQKNGSQAVYVAQNGIARLQPVQTGIQEGWRIQITQGLQPGDQVVVVGHRDINGGAPVDVVRTVHTLEELRQ